MYKYLVIPLLLLSGCSDSEKEFHVGECVYIQFIDNKPREPWEKEPEKYISKLVQEGNRSWLVENWSNETKKYFVGSLTNTIFKDYLKSGSYNKIDCPVEEDTEFDKVMNKLEVSSKHLQESLDSLGMSQENEQIEELSNEEESDSLPPLEPLERK